MDLNKRADNNSSWERLDTVLSSLEKAVYIEVKRNNMLEITVGIETITILILLILLTCT